METAQRLELLGLGRGEGMSDEIDREINSTDEMIDVPKTMFPSLAVRREIGTGLAKAAVYRCRQRGSDNYLTNLNVMLHGMIDICMQMVTQLVASGHRDQALAVEGKCRLWAQEAGEMESVMQSMEDASRVIAPDEPRLIGLDGEVMN